MSMAAFAASVLVSLFDDTNLLLLTLPLHFRAHACTNWPRLSPQHLLAGLVCGVWVSSTEIVCEDKEMR